MPQPHHQTRRALLAAFLAAPALPLLPRPAAAPHPARAVPGTVPGGFSGDRIACGTISAASIASASILAVKISGPALTGPWPSYPLPQD